LIGGDEEITMIISFFFTFFVAFFSVLVFLTVFAHKEKFEIISTTQRLNYY